MFFVFVFGMLMSVTGLLVPLGLSHLGGGGRE